MIEYWLQKKTLGGWQTVSWWAEAELAKAQASYNSCSKPDSGYSWRLIKAEVMEQRLLEDHIELLSLEEIVEAVLPKNGWGDSKPKSTWGDVKSVVTPWGIKDSVSFPKNGNHLIGKVWMIHHQLKLKKRVDPAEVDEMIRQGYERGGPKTQFRG